MKKQTLILVVGPCGSGKTVLSEKIVKEYPKLQHLDSNSFREFVSGSFPFYEDMESSINDFRKRSMNRLARSFMGNMLDELIKAGESVLFDATSLRKDTRKWRIDAAKRLKRPLTTAIIAMNTEPKIIEERLALRDAASITPQWVQNYREFGAQTYELPSADEADHIYTYTDNDAECMEFLRNI